MDYLKEMLKEHEGLRLKPYRCTAGKLTIAYGRNIEDVGVSVKEADYLLDNDLYKVRQEALENFPWFYDLSQVRRDVVCDMIFNLGLPKFLQFKKTISYLDKGDFDLASKEMLNSRWAKQVGRRATRLSEMMKQNKYLTLEGKSWIKHIQLKLL